MAAGAPTATAATGGAMPALPLPDPAAPPCGRCWEDAAISLGLVAVQLAGAAYMVVLTPILALGLDALFLVTFGSLSTGLLTLPFALNLERLGAPHAKVHALIEQCD